MTILVLGDSLSFGAELPDLPGDSSSFYGNARWDENLLKLIDINPSVYSWPTLLGKMLGHNVVNLSLIGGSNSRIFRRAIIETSANEYDLVICAWTSLGRFDLTLNGRDYCLSLGSSAESETNQWFKEFIVKHYDAGHDIERTMSEILALQSYFKQKKQKYLFVNAIRTIAGSEYKLLIDQIDHDHFITWHESFCMWCKGLPFGPSGHFLEQGHELVAQRMFDYIKRLNLL